jgi:DNA-damage-inducible protein J
MPEARLSVRVDGDMKQQAELVFRRLGINMSTGINMYLSRVVQQKGIPFSLSLDRSEMLDKDTMDMENAAILAVRESIRGLRKKGIPVARYDAEQKRPYFEYPGGRREYSIE